MKRRRYNFETTPKTKRKNLLIGLAISVFLLLFFMPGPNGLVKVIYKSYKKQKLYKEIEQLKIKAELIQSKIAKAQNDEYLRKFLRDYYYPVSKDSTP